MSDVSISYLYNLTFSSTRARPQSTSNGDWIRNPVPRVTGVPCCVDRMGQREAVMTDQLQGQITDVLNCPAGTDIVKGDLVTVSNGLQGRVMEVYDASNRGHHVIAWLDRRQLGG